MTSTYGNEGLRKVMASNQLLCGDKFAKIKGQGCQFGHYRNFGITLISELAGTGRTCGTCRGSLPIVLIHEEATNPLYAYESNTILIGMDQKLRQF